MIPPNGGSNEEKRSEEKIIQLYMETQKMMCMTYFDKIYIRIDTLKEIEEYTHKLNEYGKIVGRMLENNELNDEINEYTNKMESKLNKKYIDLYAKQSKHSLIVVYQNKLLNFFRRIANWIGNRA